MAEAWWLEEAAYAGAEHLDEEYVAAYDAKAQVDPAEDVARFMSLGLDRSSVLIDMGAGTGVFTLAAAATGASVVAVDVSPAMIATISDRAGRAGLDNIKTVHGGFLSYQHAGPPADFVYTRNALHQLPDFWKVVALDRIGRMMRPGGTLLLRDLVFDLEPGAVARGIEEWMKGAVDDPARGFTAAELAEHVRKEYSTFTWLLEPMLDRCGFEVIEQTSRRSAYGMYLCRRKFVG